MGGNTRKNTLQLAMQHCYATSCMGMLLVLPYSHLFLQCKKREIKGDIFALEAFEPLCSLKSRK